MGTEVTQKMPGCSRSFCNAFVSKRTFQILSVIYRPMPTQTISLGTPSAASLINTTNGVVTLRRTSAGHKEVSLSPPPESQDQTRHRLWNSQLAIASRQEIDATLTAVLPLEFNSLIFGYSEF